MRRHTTFTRLTLSRLDGRNLPSAVISHEVATPIFDTAAEPAACEVRIALNETQTKLPSKPVIATAEFTRPERLVGTIKQAFREEAMAARTGGDDRIEVPAAAVQVREQKLVQLSLT